MRSDWSWSSCVHHRGEPQRFVVFCGPSRTGSRRKSRATHQSHHPRSLYQYANVVEGVVVKLAQPDTPIKLLEGLAGQHVDVIDCATKSKYRLFDAAQLVMETLHFLPPDRRPANESLVVWKSTADALLVDDLATADREKTAVEAHQRELRRQREADGQPFVPQYFHYDDALEAFVPNEGLAERQTAFLEGKR